MLTDLKIQRLNVEQGKTKRHKDRDGLSLEVRASGKKVFIFRFQWHKKPQTITLGNYPSLSLAEARNQVLTYRESINKDIDPRQADEAENKNKIAPGIYQYTAVDDCSRWRVLEIYRRRTATNTLHFLDLVLEQFPFPIQRIQTDRGLEFFAEKVQLKMMELGVKFRPNKPASPHLNGKVERSQKTDIEEFYAITDLSDFETLREELAQWQFFYNWQRPHGSLKGKPPSAIVAELSEITPLSEEVGNNYKIDNERIQIANYHTDLIMKKLKGSI